MTISKEHFLFQKHVGIIISLWFLSLQISLKSAVLEVCIHDVVEPYRIKRHSFQWHVVLIIVSGKMKFFDNGNEYVLEAGEIWVGLKSLMIIGQ